MKTNTNIFENSWKEFAAEFQKQHKIWNKMTDEYFDYFNNSRKAMLNNFQKQYDGAVEKTEQEMKETVSNLKKVSKETSPKEKAKEPEKTSHSDIIEGNWKQLMGEIQKQWGKLTNENLDQINGSREKLAGTIQKNYGIAHEEAEKQMKEWEKTRTKLLKTATS